MEIIPIAHFRSPFSSKFGIPKQSGLVENLQGTIVFEPAFRDADALRGLEGFSHIWLIWEFSANQHKSNSPVVRPPVLGGNQSMGVFATRSPYRPNPIGLSSVRIDRIDLDDSRGPVIHVLGADLMDGTPIFDIKPYIPYADCHSDALSGFTGSDKIRRLQVVIPDEISGLLSAHGKNVLTEVLSLDPRPRYQNDASRIYGMPFGVWDVRFSVEGDLLTVLSIDKTFTHEK